MLEFTPEFPFPAENYLNFKTFYAGEGFRKTHFPWEFPEENFSQNVSGVKYIYILELIDSSIFLSGQL